MHATHHDVDTFKTLLLRRFTPVDEGLEDVGHLIETLRQDATESLEDYYRRAEDLLHVYGGQDGIDPVKLSTPEGFILRRVIRYYVNGLHHSCLRSSTALQGKSLLQTYRITRGHERLMLEMGKTEYMKMKEENDLW